MLHRTLSLLIMLFLAIAPVAQALGQCAVMGIAKEVVHQTVAGHQNTSTHADDGLTDKAATEKGCYGDELCFSHFHAINTDLNSSKPVFRTRLLPNTPYRISLISQISPPEIKPPIDRL